MEYLVLTLMGGAILFLIFHFLPMRISLLQKLLFVSLSIVFSHMFLLLHSFLDSWQVIVIILLAILITTYFFTKYTNKYSNEHQEKQSNQVETSATPALKNENPFLDEQDKILKSESSIEKEQQSNLEVEVSEKFVPSSTELEQLEKATEEDSQKEKIELTQNELIEQVSAHFKEAASGLAEESNEDELQGGVTAEYKELEAKHNSLENHQDDTETESTITITEKLDGSSEEVEAVVNGKELIEGEQVATGFNEEGIELNQQEDHKTMELEIDDNTVQKKEVTEMDEEVINENKPKIQEENETQLLETEEDIKAQDRASAEEDETEATHFAHEEDDEQIPEKYENSHPMVDTVISENQDDTVENSELIADQNEEELKSTESKIAQAKRVNRDLMDTLIQQLLWYKKQISSEDYEKLIIDHAKENLHDYDYYLFAALLRDHYITTEQFDKLKSLLNQLKQRYNSKAVILEEITFFEKKFL